MTLAILVTYCSNERLFADELLTACLAASDLVCVAVGRKLFNGQDEDVAHIQDLALRYSGAHFVWFDVPEELLRTPIILHNKARLTARDAARRVLHLRGETLENAWVILMDGDEVPCEGGESLATWWKTERHVLKSQNVYKLANQWFFLHRRLLSEGTEDSVVLVSGSFLTDENLSHPRERDGVCMAVCHGGAGVCVHDVRGIDGRPMFDHFSWVRSSRRHLVAKVTNWGHHGERDWVALVNHAYDEMEAGRFPVVDFVHGRKLILLPQTQKVTERLE